MSRKSGYSGVTDVDMVVFGHDLEGGDKDGASMLKDCASACCGVGGSCGATEGAVRHVL